MEERPTSVPKAKQVGTLFSPDLGRWLWSAPSVWTARMLTTLEEGVKGGVWYSLIDKVWSLRNLQAAVTKVISNQGAAGVDHVTTAMFESHRDTNLQRLQEDLRNATYVPQEIQRQWIPKLGSNELRPLGIPTVRDRVVQTALRNVLEPIFEKDFAEHSYGFRPNRGCKDALGRVETLLKGGYEYVVDVDLKSYFDTIPHDRLLECVRAKIADGRVLDLLKAYLQQKVMDELQHWTPEQGTPQGAVISPLLSNIYLDPLDHVMAQEGYEMVRYADDMVVLCRTRAEADRALARIEEWTTQVGLTVHPTKTRIVHADKEGFDFLGYHFERGMRWPRPKSLQKFKETIRRKTRRTDGRSLLEIIADVTRTLRGWFEYFKHSHKTTFNPLDSWIRMRLRSILRRRRGKRGRGRGSDHQTWPNDFFARLGLYSLKAAHRSARQSCFR